MEEQEKRKKKWIERMANRCRAYKPYLYNRFFVFMLLIFIVALISGLYGNFTFNIGNFDFVS